MLLGTQAMIEADLAPSATLVSFVFVTALADLIVGSATAKWAVLAPIVVPMLMSTGISPSMATAAYRFGDGALNIVTPLNPYLAFVLLSCRRWRPDFNLAQMFRALCPFAAVYLLLGAGIVLAWSLAELPPGPTSTFRYEEGR
jgi:aminobenzoyl-glutamate transport protein